MAKPVKLGKNMGALKVSKQPAVDHADRAHYDVVAPNLPTGTIKGVMAASLTGRRTEEDDDAEIVIVEHKRRSTDPHPYERRAVVVSRKKIVGGQG
jgi:hypothetical protein